jgi:hypothetical protein
LPKIRHKNLANFRQSANVCPSDETLPAFFAAEQKSRSRDHRGNGLWRIGIGLKTDPENVPVMRFLKN